jgi:hypothetical protein
MSKCADCRYAEWQRTPTGRISKKHHGKCKWTATVLVSAACREADSDCEINLKGGSIWADFDYFCPVFERTQAAQEAEQ